MKRYLAIALVIVASVAVVAGAVYGYFAYQQMKEENRALALQVAAFNSIGNATLKRLIIEKEMNQSLNDAYSNLNDVLIAKQGENQELESQIHDISSTVGTLQKLAATPPELLKKYSKVYFLNENYVPSPLVQIDSRYLFDTQKPQEFLGDAWPFLQRMLAAADAAGKKLEVVSGYRSYGEQSELKSSYTVVYGSGANQFSADQGYSEHQLGTAVDLAAPDSDGLSIEFASTAAGEWLQQNAFRYGFILSYPKDNSYYVYEPWHWRFVGVALATSLYLQNKHFYDLSQPEIDSYLIHIFDQ